jgi:hypothetical protein
LSRYGEFLISVPVKGFWASTGAGSQKRVTGTRGRIPSRVYQSFSDIAGACQMNTRLHCSKSPPTGIGGHRKPASITGNSRIGSVGLRPSAGSHIHRKNCWIWPGVMMPEPIASAAKLPTDDRRTGRLGVLGNGWPDGLPDVASAIETLVAASALCSRRGVLPRRRQWLAHRFRSDLCENAF